MTEKAEATDEALGALERVFAALPVSACRIVDKRGGVDEEHLDLDPAKVGEKLQYLVAGSVEPVGISLEGDTVTLSDVVNPHRYLSERLPQYDPASPIEEYGGYPSDRPEILFLMGNVYVLRDLPPEELLERHLELAIGQVQGGDVEKGNFVVSVGIPKINRELREEVESFDFERWYGTEAEKVRKAVNYFLLYLELPYFFDSFTSKERIIYEKYLKQEYSELNSYFNMNKLTLGSLTGLNSWLQYLGQRLELDGIELDSETKVTFREKLKELMDRQQPVKRGDEFVYLYDDVGLKGKVAMSLEYDELLRLTIRRILDIEKRQLL